MPNENRARPGDVERPRRDLAGDAGRDVLAVTLANHGIEPVHPDPIDLILRDPEADAEAISKALLGYLETGTPPGDIHLGLEYVADFTSTGREVQRGGSCR